MEESNEYIVFETTDRAGNTIEMAVLEEFEFDNRNYCAAGLVEGDTISEDGVYLFRIESAGDDFNFSKITDPDEYTKAAEAYAEM